MTGSVMIRMRMNGLPLFIRNGMSYGDKDNAKNITEIKIITKKPIIFVITNKFGCLRKVWIGCCK